MCIYIYTHIYMYIEPHLGSDPESLDLGSFLQAKPKEGSEDALASNLSQQSTQASTRNLNEVVLGSG